VPIVLFFILQKVLTHAKQVVQSGPSFCSCSLKKHREGRVRTRSRLARIIVRLEKGGREERNSSRVNTSGDLSGKFKIVEVKMGALIINRSAGKSMKGIESTGIKR